MNFAVVIRNLLFLLDFSDLFWKQRVSLLCFFVHIKVSKPKVLTGLTIPMVTRYIRIGIGSVLPIIANNVAPIIHTK